MKKRSDLLPLHQLHGKQFFVSTNAVAFGEHSQDHRIEFYAFIWFLETKGSHFIDFEEYPIQKNLVYLLSKNQVHSIPSEQLPNAKIIVCSAAFFDMIGEHHLRQLFLAFDNSGIAIPNYLQDTFSQLFQQIVAEYNGDAENNMLLTYVRLLLMHLYRLRWNQNPQTNTNDDRIIQLLKLLESNFLEERHPDFYAKQLGLTSKRINEMLRHKMGTTVSRLIERLLLIEAKRSLRFGQDAIKEIAYNLGFSDQSYFARFFKKHTGISPEIFRSQPSL